MNVTQEPKAVYVSTNGEQKGPYVKAQIQTMWDHGVLTADSLFWDDGTETWRPVSDLLRQNPQPAKEPPALPGSKTGSRLKEAFKATSIGFIVAIGWCIVASIVAMAIPAFGNARWFVTFTTCTGALLFIGSILAGFRALTGRTVHYSVFNHGAPTAVNKMPTPAVKGRYSPDAVSSVVGKIFFWTITGILVLALWIAMMSRS